MKSSTYSPGRSGVLRKMIEKNESDEHIATTGETGEGGKMAQTRWRKMRKTAVLKVTGSSSTQRGDMVSKKMSYLSKIRDTSKDHSFTSKMTGKDLILGRDAHLFTALMPTGNPWKPQASLLSSDHCLINQSAKGYRDDSKYDRTMGMIRMRPVWVRDSYLC